MSLYSEWEDSVKTERTNEEFNQYWKDYYKAEAENYKIILASHKTVIEGTVAELSARFKMEPFVFIGFLDGINSSLADGELNLDELTEDSKVVLNVDYEKLYYNMHAAKADWLYNMKEWDDVLSEDKRKELTKQYRESLVYVAAPKIGRNDPCPCGSGKKYKKCCGK